MSDYELFLIDAEYWLGFISEKELRELIPDAGFARLKYMESLYGLGLNSMDHHEDLRGSGDWFEIRSWFSLLVATDTTIIWESPECWPFPYTVGSIPTH